MTRLIHNEKPTHICFLYRSRNTRLIKEKNLEISEKAC